MGAIECLTSRRPPRHQKEQGCSHMAKGRYAGPKQKKGGGVRGNRLGTDAATTSAGPLFLRIEADASTGRFTSPALLTLIFQDKDGQHRALARIEAFYESKSSDAERRFLTLQEASQQRLCPNYEAFNCPVAVVREWLACMQRAHDAPTTFAATGQADDAVPWWKPYCNVEENELLDYLASLGCLEGAKDGDDVPPADSAPSYIITALASQATSSLPHERLHFLYFASQSYRDLAQRQFASLSAKARRVVEADLNMRGYAAHVHIDEFQAYVSLNRAEFGKHISDECASVQPALLHAQKKLWTSIAVDQPCKDDDDAGPFM